jgi:uncharacterized protein YkwD
VFLAIGFYWGFGDEKTGELKGRNEAVPREDKSLEVGPGEEAVLKAELSPGSVGRFIGMELNILYDEFGSPDRTEPSAYGYTWLIYNSNPGQYFQAGVLDNRVVTLYAVGEQVNIAPFEIGQEVETIFINNLIEPEVSLDFQGSSFKYELSEVDINTRPLVKVGDHYVQLYIDRYTGSLSSVRFLDAETLLKHKPYELVYRGNLLEAAGLSQEEWREVEKGAERQIFDISNVMRLRNGLGMLRFDENISSVAYAHSKDMMEANYFSHESPQYGSLSDRLDVMDIPYALAGENIAAHYVDGPAVMEGWLNSKGHREALLNEEFTHLGVGVFQKHYTQNFVKNK